MVCLAQLLGDQTEILGDKTWRSLKETMGLVHPHLSVGLYPHNANEPSHILKRHAQSAPALISTFLWGGKWRAGCGLVWLRETFWGYDLFEDYLDMKVVGLYLYIYLRK